MPVEKSHHQYGHDGHQHRNDTDDSNALPFLFCISGRIFWGDMNHELRKARSRLRVASLTGGEGGLFFLREMHWCAP